MTVKKVLDLKATGKPILTTLTARVAAKRANASAEGEKIVPPKRLNATLPPATNDDKDPRMQFSLARAGIMAGARMSNGAIQVHIGTVDYQGVKSLAIVVSGYERCHKCGEWMPSGEDCPECGNVPQPSEKL
jgi:hypothetical protein